MNQFLRDVGLQMELKDVCASSSDVNISEPKGQ